MSFKTPPNANKPLAWSDKMKTRAVFDCKPSSSGSSSNILGKKLFISHWKRRLLLESEQMNRSADDDEWTEERDEKS